MRTKQSVPVEEKETERFFSLKSRKCLGKRTERLENEERRSTLKQQISSRVRERAVMLRFVQPRMDAKQSGLRIGHTPGLHRSAR